MITKIQSNTNNNYNSSPSFGDNIICKSNSTVAKKFKTCVDKFGRKDEGILPHYLDEKGLFNVKKFFSDLRKRFKEETITTHDSYVLKNFRKSSDGSIKVSMENVKDKKDRFSFNITHLFQNDKFAQDKPNVNAILSDKMDSYTSSKAKAAVQEKYKTNIAMDQVR